jgi:hypothetical protein
MLKLLKNGGVYVLSTMSSIHKLSSILTTRALKKTMKKSQKNEQPWTLNYKKLMVFEVPIFGLDQLIFLPK